MNLLGFLRYFYGLWDSSSEYWKSNLMVHPEVSPVSKQWERHQPQLVDKNLFLNELLVITISYKEKPNDFKI